MQKKLYRSNTDKMLSGVLGGIAEYFGIDSTLVRILFAAVAVFTAAFPCIMLYIICAIVIPSRPIDIE
ncbi:MAG TPA: PspC domain-containing protein [Candidatus Fimenecus stercoravium]|nr:PspC domain-containing protein [Candidatus Fimenecus stercoravium]